MNSKQYLLISGAILFLAGILGYVGILGPTSDKSLFHQTWWFDNQENLVDTLLGITGLFSAFTFPKEGQKYLAVLFGTVGVIIGIYSIFSSKPLIGANLENPADSIFHLILGVWALYVSLIRGRTQDALSTVNNN